jgi:hypothetical protein
MISVRGSSNSSRILASSPLYLTHSTLTTTTCILRPVISEASPLWQLMPKGEGSDEKRSAEKRSCQVSLSGGVVGGLWSLSGGVVGGLCGH